jgi:uncharacterized protein (TIGR02145 family)
MASFHRITQLFFPVLLVLLTFTNCSKEDEKPATVPVLTTAPVSFIDVNSAVSGGVITSDGGAAVTARGICWSLTADPKISDFHTESGTGTGTFTSFLNDLLSDTTYYVRAWATNSEGTAYGNVQSFRTAKVVQWVVTDIDGNNYTAFKMGDQTWLTENLKVTRYRNGDEITNVTTDNQWKNMTTGAYCSFENLLSNFTTYGALYNWHALNDPRGLCPEGYHVPDDSEWAILAEHLGGDSVAGGKMKSTGTIEGGTGLWYQPNTGATNTSSFNGLPGGYRINYGTFYSLGNVGYFWSASDTASANAWNYVLDANNKKLGRIFNFKTNGFSVRCCKD